MSDATLSRRAVAVFAATAALLAASGAFRLVHDGYGDAYAPVFYVAWAVVGLVLAVRRPRNAIGWLFLAAAACWAASGVAGHYAMFGLQTAPGSLPGPVLAFWVMTWAWLAGLVLLPTFGLLLFPDGRLPSPRWRWPARAAGAGIGLAMLAYTLAPWQGNDEFGWAPAGVENPLHTAGLAVLHDPLLAVGLPLILAGIVTGVAALVFRYRRATPGVRQQLKWALFGGIASVTIYLTGDLTTRLPGIEWWLVTLLAVVVFPVTILTAALRYRLYDIDRLVSRTVAYGVVLAVLAGLFVGGVAGMTTLLPTQDRLAVAVTTVVAVAVFDPLRRRIVEVVDRRFDRTRYVARQLVEEFGREVQDVTNLDEIGDRVHAVVSRTVAPATVAVWRPGWEVAP